MTIKCGISSESYEQDNAIFRTKTHWTLLGLLFAILIFLPFLISSFLTGVLNIILIYIIASTGLNILTGYCGQISLGHAAFWGVGAYASAILANTYGLPIWIALPGAVLITGIVGVILGFPSLRVKGFYLAMSTMAAQFILFYIFAHWESVTGAYSGISCPRPRIGSFVFNTETKYYYLILTFTILAIYVAKNIARMRTGRAFIAVRDNDLAAEMMGINLLKTKLTAFFIASCYAGLAGSLWGYYLTHVFPGHFDLMHSVWFIGMIIVGGMGSTMGPIFGVFFIKILEQLATIITEPLAAVLPASMSGGISASLVSMMFAAIIIIFLAFEPRGIVHRWEIFKATYRLWPFAY
jgi:branched-chain amino acid transport system permease protein